jgi:hypothetical protein
LARRLLISDPSYPFIVAQKNPMKHAVYNWIVENVNGFGGSLSMASLNASFPLMILTSTSACFCKERSVSYDFKCYQFIYIYIFWVSPRRCSEAARARHVPHAPIDRVPYQTSWLGRLRNSCMSSIDVFTRRLSTKIYFELWPRRRVQKCDAGTFMYRTDIFRPCR